MVQPVTAAGTATATAALTPTATILILSVWDNWELVEEYAGGMQRTEGYVQGATGVIKTLVSNLYYYQDKLGSTTHVANASGVLLEHYRYDLYGTPSYFNALSTQLSTSNYSVNDLYAGERWIPELGLYDLRNRFMSPELGRFLQPDPIGFKGDASNLYRYCGNDPIDKTDPMGLIDSNNFDPNTPDYLWAQRANLDKYANLFTYGAHGGDHDHNYGQALNPAYRSTGQTIPLDTVIATIKGNAIFQHKCGTLLIVCNSGADRSTFARSVAMGTGRDVLAPNKYLWLLDQKEHPFVVAGGYRDRRTGELKMNPKDPGHLTRFHPDGSSKAGADFQISAKDANGAQLAAGGGASDIGSSGFNRQLDRVISDYQMGVGDNSGEGFHPRGPR